MIIPSRRWALGIIREFPDVKKISEGKLAVIISRMDFKYIFFFNFNKHLQLLTQQNQQQIEEKQIEFITPKQLEEKRISQKKVEKEKISTKKNIGPISDNNSDNNIINVIFLNGKLDNKISIQINSSEKVSTLIQKYRLKSGDSDIKKKFIYMAKALIPSLICKQAGLVNNAIVHVINTRYLEGALNIIF